MGDALDTGGEGAGEDKGGSQVSCAGGGVGLGRITMCKNIVHRTTWCYLILQNGASVSPHQAYLSV